VSNDNPNPPFPHAYKAPSSRPSEVSNVRQAFERVFRGVRFLVAASVACGVAHATDDYFPPPEAEGGWRRASPESLGVDPVKLQEALEWHRSQPYTANLGGAIVVVYCGHVIAEDYVTGTHGGPQPWTAEICNDMKSSTKSVFGTAAGVFLEEYKDQITLDSLLVGTSRENSLIPQIWDRPVTDPRKQRITFGHALSMTSGHTNEEPWWYATADRKRHRADGYEGPLQMFSYFFGWWWFEGIPNHKSLLFEPGTDFKYSNFGLEQVSLAIRNISGELVGPYLYDRVLGKIGLPRGVRDNRYVNVPYQKTNGARDPEYGLNYSFEPGWAVGGGEGGNAYGGDGQASPFGVSTIAGSTFRVTARDYARIAYLWLRKGRWGDAQLVPSKWMEVATRRHVRADGTTPDPYGYTFWVHDQVEGVPADTFMSHGDRFNDGYVIPSLDLVVVRQGNINVPDRNQTRHALLRRLLEALPSGGRRASLPATFYSLDEHDPRSLVILLRPGVGLTRGTLAGLVLDSRYRSPRKNRALHPRYFN
jgi:CubicO group peptidase (beta-lactamase class C family)